MKMQSTRFLLKTDSNIQFSEVLLDSHWKCSQPRPGILQMVKHARFSITNGFAGTMEATGTADRYSLHIQRLRGKRMNSV